MPTTTLTPDLPFWHILFAQGGDFGPPSTPNPYASNLGGASYGSPPPKKSNAILWILLIIGGGLILGCGCCAGASIFGFRFGMNKAAEEVATQMANHPAVVEHIGTIESHSLDFGASIEETQKRGAQTGQNFLVIRLKGSKGSGDIIGVAPKGEGSKLINPILRLPSGEEIPLGP